MVGSPPKHVGQLSVSRLAYQRLVENLDIRRAEIITGAGNPQHVVTTSHPFIASTKSEDHPQYSPDGTKIAFVSRRPGTYEIWSCASDGSNPVRLTSMSGPVLVGPQWSPDGRRIAFFAGIYFIDFDMPSEAGRPIQFFDFQSRRVKQLGTVENTVKWTNTPGFAVSPDGRWASVHQPREHRRRSHAGLQFPLVTAADPSQLGRAVASTAPLGERRNVSKAWRPTAGRRDRHT
jgi:hypothetical protein